ncbi:hypothetical protein JCM11251_006689 [Rhodosporidiobolus azoricus]
MDEKRSFHAHPMLQVLLISLVCLACPGMFNALSGVGGGGQLDPTTAANGNVALYSTFAVVGFFAGSIVNMVGYRLAFAVGASGYALYMGSLLSFNRNGNSGFVIAAGALLGCCAGLLWTAQGALTLAYATERTKGRAFALFWAVFNLGGVLGSAIELGLTYKNDTGTVGDSVYIVFLSIGAAACLLPLLLANPASVVRVDGTKVVVPVHPSWKEELIGMYQLFRRDYWILLLLPFFAASNVGSLFFAALSSLSLTSQITQWFNTYEQNSFNGALFTLRTRSLNSLLFWLAQIVAAGLFGLAIDLKQFRRTTRAWAGLAFLLAVNMAVWGAAYHYQKGYYRTPTGASIPRIDFKDPGYGGRCALFVFMGVLDAVLQNYIYWLMGSMYSSAGELARIVGIYKGIQSAAAAGAWRMDSVGTSYMTELGSTWGLCVAAIVCAAPVVAFRIKDHTDELVTPVSDSASMSSAEAKKAEEA